MCHRKVRLGKEEVAVGDVVLLALEGDEQFGAGEEEDAEAPLGLVQALWQTPSGKTRMSWVMSLDLSSKWFEPHNQ